MIYDLADSLKWCGWVSYCNGLSVSSIQLGDPLGLPIDLGRGGGREYFSHYAFGSSAGWAGARGPGRRAASRGAARPCWAQGLTCSLAGPGGGCQHSQHLSGHHPLLGPALLSYLVWPGTGWVLVPAPTARSCLAGRLRCSSAMCPGCFGPGQVVVSPLLSMRSPPPRAWE